MDTIFVSNSSIQNFKFCRRKYWLENVRKLRPIDEDTTGALPLGSRVHKALEIFYNFIVEGKTAEQANITGIWKDLCELDRIEILSRGEDTADFDKEAELGRIMLEGYVEWLEDEGYLSEYTIVSQEETLQAPLLDGRVVLIGKIDQRIKHNVSGFRTIVDFKTAAQLAPLEKTILQNEQFLTYNLLELLQENDESHVSGAMVVALKKVRRSSRAAPPFYAAYEVQHNLFTLRNFYRRLLGELEEIVRFHQRLEDKEDPLAVAYPSPGKDCSWRCSFSEICHMFDDGSDVERAISDKFVSGSPFDYYGADDPLSESK